MAAPTLETNAAADTLRILAGTSGDPVTWNDVWDWDDGGGSSGGDGDVPKDGGGTAKVDTFMTETVADRAYIILKNVDFGDGSTPTYFGSDLESVLWSAGAKFYVKASATLRLGQLYGSYPDRGSFWDYSPGVELDLISSSGGTFLLYGSIFLIRDNAALIDMEGGTWSAVNSIILGRTYQDTAGGHKLRIYGGTVNFTDVLLANLRDYRMNATPNTYANVHSHRNLVGVAVSTVNESRNISIIGGSITDYGANHQFRFGSWGTGGLTVSIIDFEGTVADVFWEAIVAGAWAKEIYTCNIHIADKDGANLAGVTVDCEDTNGTATWTAGSITTDANGDIAEQQITYKQYTASTATYSPHKFTISYPGYETLVMDAVTVDTPIVWKLELQPMRARNYARSRVQGVQFQ